MKHTKSPSRAPQARPVGGNRPRRRVGRRVGHRSGRLRRGMAAKRERVDRAVRRPRQKQTSRRPKRGTRGAEPRITRVFASAGPRAKAQDHGRSERDHHGSRDMQPSGEKPEHKGAREWTRTAAKVPDQQVGPMRGWWADPAASAEAGREQTDQRAGGGRAMIAQAEHVSQAKRRPHKARPRRSAAAAMQDPNTRATASATARPKPENGSSRERVPTGCDRVSQRSVTVQKRRHRRRGRRDKSVSVVNRHITNKPSVQKAASIDQQERGDRQRQRAQEQVWHSNQEQSR